MGRHKKPKKEEVNQLYNYFQEIKNLTNSEDDWGFLMGYSVVVGLENFASNSGSQEETNFEQVKAVYQKLEKIIKKSSENEVYHIICDLKEIDLKLEDYIGQEKHLEKKGELFQRTIEFFIRSKKNYEDQIRLNGLELIDKIRDRGKVIGKRNSLINDYDTIKSAFTREKGDRR